MNFLQFIILCTNRLLQFLRSSHDHLRLRMLFSFVVRCVALTAVHVTQCYGENVYKRTRLNFNSEVEPGETNIKNDVIIAFAPILSSNLKSFNAPINGAVKTRATRGKAPNYWFRKRRRIRKRSHPKACSRPHETRRPSVNDCIRHRCSYAGHTRKCQPVPTCPCRYVPPTTPPKISTCPPEVFKVCSPLTRCPPYKDTHTPCPIARSRPTSLTPPVKRPKSTHAPCFVSSSSTVPTVQTSQSTEEPEFPTTCTASLSTAEENEYPNDGSIKTTTIRNDTACLRESKQKMTLKTSGPNAMSL